MWGKATPIHSRRSIRPLFEPLLPLLSKAQPTCPYVFGTEDPSRPCEWTLRLCAHASIKLAVCFGSLNRIPLRSNDFTALLSRRASSDEQDCPG